MMKFFFLPFLVLISFAACKKSNDNSNLALLSEIKNSEKIYRIKYENDEARTVKEIEYYTIDRTINNYRLTEVISFIIADGKLKGYQKYDVNHSNNNRTLKLTASFTLDNNGYISDIDYNEEGGNTYKGIQRYNAEGQLTYIEKKYPTSNTFEYDANGNLFFPNTAVESDLHKETITHTNEYQKMQNPFFRNRIGILLCICFDRELFQSFFLSKQLPSRYYSEWNLKQFPRNQPNNVTNTTIDYYESQYSYAIATDGTVSSSTERFLHTRMLDGLTSPAMIEDKSIITFYSYLKQ